MPKDQDGTVYVVVKPKQVHLFQYTMVQNVTYINPGICMTPFYTFIHFLVSL